MKKMILMALAGIVMFAGCNKSEKVNPSVPSVKNHPSGSTMSSTNGSAGIELIYYDGQLFKMNLNPFSDQAGSSLLAHNKSANTLYEADGFVTVTDAIQGDGYNPVWQEVDIVFNSGFTPHQFFKDDDITAAASGANPEIKLVPTGEMYRCDIIQHTKAQ